MVTGATREAARYAEAGMAGERRRIASLLSAAMGHPAVEFGGGVTPEDAILALAAQRLNLIKMIELREPGACAMTPTEGIWVLVRKVKPLRWEKWGEYESLAAADAVWKRSIKGRGITAWAAFVSPADGARMLADPDALPSVAERS